VTTDSSAAPDRVPACGGAETPFTTRTGRRLLYMWNPTTGEHACYDLQRDAFLTTDDAAIAALAMS
jgi:hypothetical protein